MSEGCVCLSLFPSLRPHWKASPSQTEVMFSVLVARVQLLSWRQQRQSHVRAAGRGVLGSASSRMLLVPHEGLALRGSAPPLCQGQPGGLRFNEVLFHMTSSITGKE